jgi:hypothetical protein
MTEHEYQADIFPELGEGDRTEEYHVGAVDTSRPVSGVGVDGKRYPLGELITTAYEGGARRLYLMPEGAASPVRLGTISADRYVVPDHYQVARPLLERGFVPRVLRTRRGGASFFGLFSHPDLKYPSLRVPDGKGREDLEYSIGVWNSLKTGHAVRVVGGFFRIICTNGLLDQLLNLGEGSFDHRSISRPLMESWFDETIPTAETLERYLLPPLTNKRGLEWVLNQLPLGTEEDARRVEGAPRWLQKDLNILLNRPQGYRDALHGGLQELLDVQEADQLHLLNTVTDAGNVYTQSLIAPDAEDQDPQRHRPLWIDWEYERIVESLRNLSNLAEVFRN